jgi:hypothetical protein
MYIHESTRIYNLIIQDNIRTRRVSCYPLAAICATSCYHHARAVCAVVCFIYIRTLPQSFMVKALLCNVVVTVISIVFFTYAAQRWRQYHIICIAYACTRGNYELHMGSVALAKIKGLKNLSY